MVAPAQSTRAEERPQGVFEITPEAAQLVAVVDEIHADTAEIIRTAGILGDRAPRGSTLLAQNCHARELGHQALALIQVHEGEEPYPVIVWRPHVPCFTPPVAGLKNMLSPGWLQCYQLKPQSVLTLCDADLLYCAKVVRIVLPGETIK